MRYLDDLQLQRVNRSCQWNGKNKNKSMQSVGARHLGKHKLEDREGERRVILTRKIGFEVQTWMKSVRKLVLGGALLLAVNRHRVLLSQT
jgi:hypothetical protein